MHCHVDASVHTVKTLRNIVNIMAAKEDLPYKALQVNVDRERYCKKILLKPKNRKPDSPPSARKKPHKSRKNRANQSNTTSRPTSLLFL